MSDSGIEIWLHSKDQCSELYLHDREYRLIAAGLASVTAIVEPGLFKIRQRIGDFEVSEIIEVTRSGSHDWYLQGVRSLVQLPWHNKDYSQNAIDETVFGSKRERGSKREALHGRLRLSISVDRNSKENAQRICQECRIGEPLKHSGPTLWELGAQIDEDSGLLYLDVLLPVGSHFLRWAATDDRMSLWITENWTLHIFLQAIGPEYLSSLFRSENISQLYARPEQKLVPDDPKIWFMETLRLAFARGRTELAVPLARELKARDNGPMLGLFCGHLLLDAAAALGYRKAGRTMMELASCVIEQTAGSVGADCPDILALRYRLKTSETGHRESFRQKSLDTPVLKASWSATMPELFGGPIEVNNTPVWFVWAPLPYLDRAAATPELLELRDSSFSADARPQSALSELISSKGLRGWLDYLGTDEILNDDESVHLNQLDRDLLVTIASAQANVDFRIISAADATVFVRANMNVPTGMLDASALKLRYLFDQWGTRIDAYTSL
jgi:hypothetical protein